jgi:mono/diheme cytochrome c family protein
MLFHRFTHAPLPRLIAGLVFCCLIPNAKAQDLVDYARDVLPILSDNCFQCHGPDAKSGREGDLRLDDEADVRRDRDGHAVVVAHDLEASELFQRVTSSDAGDRMPPPELGRTLSAAQVEVIRKWILQGAPWGKHWAFEVPQRNLNFDTKTHPVDAIVQRQLETIGLKANARATRETLIRRLSLDLTGLPPTPQAVDAFLADHRPDAWPQLVERTLASEAYGERMAWDWLEAARYADTNGYQGDNERTMWPWRDWVVRAFNANMPYDEFTVLQLAGDLLPDATDEQIMATGFCRNHMINGEGGRIAEENRVDYVMDMTETMGTVWLGLTLNCCRCHDHKFDPLLQRDYYQLNAFFNQTPVDGAGGNAQTTPVIAVPDTQQRTQIVMLETALEAINAQLLAAEQRLNPLQSGWEQRQLEQHPASEWRVLMPTSAVAKTQKLERLEKGFVLASGDHPSNDSYTVTYALPKLDGPLAAFKLEAVRHPSMANGSLSRAGSGNFVLTNIQFDFDGDSQAKETSKAEVAFAEATFEQGDLKVAGAIDDDPESGWAVWNGKNVDRDHAAVFRLKEPRRAEAGSMLKVELAFNSPHANHILGHFRILCSDKVDAAVLPANLELHEALKVALVDRSEEQKKKIREAYLADDPQHAELIRRREETKQQLDQVRAASPKVMVMRDQSERRATYILTRGLYNQKEDEVTAKVPSALPALDSLAGEQASRLDLARWLVSPQNPLTARVTVNRLWQMLFGIGLVKTTEDFGVQGEYPIQRELLDWLAVELIESGWDIKHILTVILTSETYQRSSEIASPALLEQDPANRYLGRGPRFRLPSWMIRDQALAVSGLLNPEVSGKPVMPYQPEGVWSEATFGKKKYAASKGDELYRRSLYTFWRRIVGPSLFFDAAKRQVCEVKPLRTNTPMHALTTLNDVTYVEAARALAERLMESPDPQRVQTLTKIVLGRNASIDELTVWEGSLVKAQTYFESNPTAATELLAVGESTVSAEHPSALLAAWTTVCLNMLNLDETLTKE